MALFFGNIFSDINYSPDASFCGAISVCLCSVSLSAFIRISCCSRRRERVSSPVSRSRRSLAVSLAWDDDESRIASLFISKSESASEGEGNIADATSSSSRRAMSRML